MPSQLISRLEETVRMCDVTIERLEQDRYPPVPLLTEIKQLRVETIAQITGLKQAAQSGTQPTSG